MDEKGTLKVLHGKALAEHNRTFRNKGKGGFNHQPARTVEKDGKRATVFELWYVYRPDK